MSAGETFGDQIEAAKDSGLGLLTDNVTYLFWIPVAWVGYKVARRIVNILV